ncbi:hypothetical protein GQ43DRAFT_460330 [Delitschia confertaspora ATCC 74209]|uniref:Lipocalin-like domain-containing protein n=1 Tax=Delitschia confertaspora ATCC 74209 TaxID=1513339 RepID=A0A9P4JWT2_9PLEO|nr:hypothetical protein GQ43DRAFT_460330 [Delitschia confertaspora ATCC 74209]
MRPTLLSLIALASAASAAPSLIPRQEGTVDYGYWYAVYTSEGFAAGSSETVVATYSNPGHASNFTSTCRETYYHGQTYRNCDAGFSYTWGAPWSDDGATLSLTQTVELGGEQVKISGSALLVRLSGLGSGKASRAEGRIEAGLASA